MQPRILGSLLQQRDRVARNLVELRQRLQHANVSQLVARQPELLLQVRLAARHRAAADTAAS